MIKNMPVNLKGLLSVNLTILFIVGIAVYIAGSSIPESVDLFGFFGDSGVLGAGVASLYAYIILTFALFWFGLFFRIYWAICLHGIMMALPCILSFSLWGLIMAAMLLFLSIDSETKSYFRN